MQNQLLMSIVAIGVAAAGMGVGTYAYFSDTGNSSGNIIGPAATVTLALNGDITPDDAVAFFSASNCLPGDLCGAGELAATNEGTSPDMNLTVDWATDYTETVPGLAGFLKVVKFDVDGVDQFGAGGCYDGFVDPRLDDIDATACISATDSFDPDSTLSIEFQLDTAAGNEYQGSSADITVRVLLRQDIDPTTIAA